jgi:hypothetical protein
VLLDEIVGRADERRANGDFPPWSPKRLVGTVSAFEKLGLGGMTVIGANRTVVSHLAMFASGPQRRLLRRSHYVRSWGEADMLTSLNRRD